MLNLNDGTYKPSQKQFDETSCIHAVSNHHLSVNVAIIIRVPTGVENMGGCTPPLGEGSSKFDGGLASWGRAWGP